MSNAFPPEKKSPFSCLMFTEQKEDVGCLACYQMVGIIYLLTRRTKTIGICSKCTMHSTPVKDQ